MTLLPPSNCKYTNTIAWYIPQVILCHTNLLYSWFNYCENFRKFENPLQNDRTLFCEIKILLWAMGIY